MKVAVLAPMIEEDQYHVDLTVRLKKNKRELTLETFYQFLLHDLDEDAMPWELKHEADIPAAGYYLTSLLKKNGYDVLLESEYDDVSLSEMARFNPEVLCLSTTMIVAIDAIKKMVERIRYFMPDIFIIAGGVFVWKNFLSSQSKYRRNVHDIYDYGLFGKNTDDPGIDAYVVAPHGAESLIMLLKEFEKGKSRDFSYIPNLILSHPKERYFRTKNKDEKVDYNEDITRWEYIDEMPQRVPLRTSIGCPYRCSFCDFCTLYPSIFLRSPESLKTELSMINHRFQNDVPVIHVSDDNVFINQKRVDEICGVFEGEKVHNWIAFMRATSVNKKNIEKVKRSGLLMSILGVESGDENQLKNMNKYMDIQDQKNGIELLDESGISVLMSFVIGFPGETKKTIDNTVKFLNSLELRNAITSYHMYPLYLFPLSELGDPDFRTKWNLTGTASQWKHATMDSNQSYPLAYRLFRNVPDIPYHYYDESHFYNRGVFSYEDRIKLFRLRNQAARQIVEGDTPGNISVTLKEMAVIMGFDLTQENDSIAERFYVKDKDKIHYQGSIQDVIDE